MNDTDDEWMIQKKKHCIVELFCCYVLLKFEIKFIQYIQYTDWNEFISLANRFMIQQIFFLSVAGIV